MRVDVIQLGVYVFGGGTLVLHMIAAAVWLAPIQRRVLAMPITWWLWRLAGIYAALGLLAIGIPTSIHPLSVTAEAILSSACLAATVPTWWLLHRWRRCCRTRRQPARDTVHDASTDS